MQMTEARLEAALARGFWTLPADESGMHIREREGRALLERARRELWVEGSISRHELVAQISKFLCLHSLGVAAASARLRISVVRPASPAAAEALRSQGYAPAAGGIWCRLHLAGLEVPLDNAAPGGAAAS